MKPKYKTSENLIIFDTTLRDGEQSPGATMTLKEKLGIAELLDRMGVNVIEAGFAAASAGDVACIEAVCKQAQYASVCSLARAVKSDIEAAAQSLRYAKKPRIHTFISTSKLHIECQFKMTNEQVLERIDKTVRYACSFCDDVEWSAMDATRSDMPFLIQAVGMAINAGAKTINIPDTVGYTLPENYTEIISTLCKRFPDTILSVHCHDDLGLATANSLAGIKAGARQVECTINGIGERAGNAAMEEIVMALKTRKDAFHCDTNIDTRQIYNTARFVSTVTGFAIQKNKAIIGANAFSHESGIHQDGMLKNRETYEIIRPESIGMMHSRIVLGKHSGRAALKNKLNAWKINLKDDEVNNLFKEFKALCDRKKHTTEEDLLALIRNQKAGFFTPCFICLVSFKTEKQELNTKDQNKEQNIAYLTLSIDHAEKKYQAVGDGSLDAIFKAINEGVKDALDWKEKSNLKNQINLLKLTNFEVHSISQGCDAQAEASIELAYKTIIYNGHALHTDVMIASALAYISAINKLIAYETSLSKQQISIKKNQNSDPISSETEDKMTIL